MENARFAVVEKRTAASIFRGREHRNPQDFFFCCKHERYRLFFHRAVRKCPRFVASKRKRHMSLKEFVQVGVSLRRLPRKSRIQSTLRTVEYCRPCLPEGGVRRIDARYFWMSVPAKMNSCSERMRTVNLYSPDCNDDDGFRPAQSRLRATEARRRHLTTVCRRLAAASWRATLTAAGSTWRCRWQG